MFDEVLIEVAKEVVDILIPLVLAGVMALITQGFVWLRKQLSVQQLEALGQQMWIIDRIARRFVLAAEQMALAGKIEAAGLAKFRWAMDKIEAELKKRGINVELDEITIYIEAKVQEEFNKLPPLGDVIEVLPADPE